MEKKKITQWDTTSHLLERHHEKEITNAGEGVEKRDPCALLVGMYIGAATMENKMEDLPKITKGNYHMI